METTENTIINQSVTNIEKEEPSTTISEFANMETTTNRQVFNSSIKKSKNMQNTKSTNKRVSNLINQTNKKSNKTRGGTKNQKKINKQNNNNKNKVIIKVC